MLLIISRVMRFIFPNMYSASKSAGGYIAVASDGKQEFCLILEHGIWTVYRLSQVAGWELLMGGVMANGRRAEGG